MAQLLAEVEDARSWVEFWRSYEEKSKLPFVNAACRDAAKAADLLNDWKIEVNEHGTVKVGKADVHWQVYCRKREMGSHHLKITVETESGDKIVEQEEKLDVAVVCAMKNDRDYLEHYVRESDLLMRVVKLWITRQWQLEAMLNDK